MPKDSAERSTYSLIETWTEQRVSYSVADVVASTASDADVEVLEVKAGAPLLQLEQLHIDEGDLPVAFTRAQVRQEFLRFTVIRDRLNA